MDLETTHLMLASVILSAAWLLILARTMVQALQALTMVVLALTILLTTTEGKTMERVTTGKMVTLDRTPATVCQLETPPSAVKKAPSRVVRTRGEHDDPQAPDRRHQLHVVGI